jgi:tricorn protease
VAYVHIPGTYGGGFSNFNRDFFSQADKEAVILDERFNHPVLRAAAASVTQRRR